MYATFDLSGATIGYYILEVHQGGQTATAPTSFPVVAAQAVPLVLQLSMPQYVRGGEPGTLTISYSNESSNDIVAPLLTISSTNSAVMFSTPDDPNDFTQVAEVLAVAPSGPAGILRPGQGGQITLTFLSTNPTSGDQIPVQVDPIANGQTIDWASMESALQPGTISTAAWNVIFDNLVAMVGTTNDSFNAALAQAATYLGSIGDSSTTVSDVGVLWSFLIAQANASFPSSMLAGTTDASLPAPGNVPLAITRTFVSSISGRYQEGIFGLGWVTSWQTSLSVAAGNVTIDSGGAPSYFELQANGTFLGTDGQYGTLTQIGGIYTLTNSAGTQYAFLPNGQLGYEQDTNGNRITLGSNNQQQLITLTYSNVLDPSEPTEQLTLSYNGQGLVSEVADGTGDTWTYSYDASGHLLAVTAPGNLTTSYTYGTLNALLSITPPDGVRQDFTYDGQGRLSNTSTGGALPDLLRLPGRGRG